jgi:hypothetical protein
VLVALAAAGCAPPHTPPPPRPAPDLRTIVIDGGVRTSETKVRQEGSIGEIRLLANPSQVWAVLPGVFQKLDIDVTTVDPDDGVLGNVAFRTRSVEGQRMSHYFDCGSGLPSILSDTHTVTLAVLIHLFPEPNGVTVVKTTLDAFSSDRALSGNATHCVSRGRLEQRIADLVRESVEG